MNEIDRLSPHSLDQIKQLMGLKKYPQAYQVIIVETAKTSYSRRKWFTAATGGNQATGYVSAFIKTYTQLSKLLNNEKCLTFTDHELQLASDQIAKTVLTQIINQDGLLPSFEEIMIMDFGTAIKTLKLTPIQWAGTPLAPLSGFKDPKPKLTHDWLIVFQASYHAVLWV